MILDSPEGERYITAMNCGINCAFANRQTLAHLARQSFATIFGLRRSRCCMM